MVIVYFGTIICVQVAKIALTIAPKIYYGLAKIDTQVQYSCFYFSRCCRDRRIKKKKDLTKLMN